MLWELKCCGEEVQKWATKMVKVQVVFMYKNTFRGVEVMSSSHHVLDAISVTCFPCTVWLTFFRLVEASFKAYSSLLILQAISLENENYAFLSTISLWCFFRESFSSLSPWDAEPSLENTALHLCHLRRSWWTFCVVSLKFKCMSNPAELCNYLCAWR